MNDNGGCFALFLYGLICCIIGVLIANKVRDNDPQAMDVYRGNTELEITSVNGVPTDSVVVFKKK